MVSTVASQREGFRFDPHLGPFCVEFACVCVGSLRVLRLPPTVQKHVRLIGDSKIVLRSECERAWLFVSVWPCDGLATCPGCTLPLTR